MQIKIENIKINSIYKLLHELPLKGKQSRHRTKFIKLLSKHLEEVAEDEQALIKEHSHLDENENPKKTDDGQRWDIKDMDAFVKDRTELLKEEFVVDGGNVTGMLKTVKKILEDLDMELSGEQGDIYDYLLDQFEAAEEETDKETEEEV